MSKRFKKEQLGVYFIMGSNNCLKSPQVVLLEAIEGGITLFQFREKGERALKGLEKEALARELQTICQTYQIPFIVNDDIELAIRLDADGVHIGQEDEPAALVRQKIGADKILGVSAHTVKEARHAMDDGADYLGIGPIFPTKTKPDAEAVKGVNLIEALRARGIEIPIVGIGGITPENASQVIEGGADGVSVITAISQASSPKEAAHQLKIAVNL